MVLVSRATAQTATRARQTASAMGVQTGYWSRLTRGGRVPNGTVERSEEGRQVRRELRHAEQDAGELREQMTSASGHRQVSLLHRLCDKMVMLDTVKRRWCAMLDRHKGARG